MKVILVNKITFDVIQIINVSNIAYDSSTNYFTITGTGGGTFNANNYNLQVLW